MGKFCARAWMKKKGRKVTSLTSFTARVCVKCSWDICLATTGEICRGRFAAFGKQATSYKIGYARKAERGQLLCNDDALLPSCSSFLPSMASAALRGRAATAADTKYILIYGLV